MKPTKPARAIKNAFCLIFMASRFINYLKDTRGELRHVSWPTRTQTIVFTVVVIGISILTSVYLGVFDYLFTRGLEFLINP